MRRWVLQVAAVALAAAVALPTGSALADDPLFVSWTSLLPGLTPGLDPDSDNLCKKGHEACVHAVIQEMTQRFKPLANDCDFDAVFSLTYLRTTEEYHRFWHEGHFSDPAWLNHYDAVFGDYYFKAFDDWRKGNTSSVPPAWQIALEASDQKRVTGTGSLFLGMSAHINRDLPFVLYSIGLAAPDGSSRKPDHDRVNEFLNRVSDALFPELAKRFDPTIDDGEFPGTADNLATFQIVPTWREQAWRNAERLANAATDAERAEVTAEIEANAALLAQTFVEQNSYNAFSTFTAADRDAYCAVHNWDGV